MPGTDLQLADFADVRLRELSGLLAHTPPVDKSRITTTVEVTFFPDVPDRVNLRLGVRLFALDSEMAADPDEEEEPVYTGSVALLAVVHDDATLKESEPQALHLADLFWPILRAHLDDHARRLGAPPLPLPVVAYSQARKRGDLRVEITGPSAE